MTRLDVGITDLVTVFMKVMVKKIMRGSTSNQSVRSTFKNVCQEKHRNTETQKHRILPSRKASFWRKALGWIEITSRLAAKLHRSQPKIRDRVLQYRWMELILSGAGFQAAEPMCQIAHR